MERYDVETNHTAKTILSDTELGTSNWVRGMLVVQWALTSERMERIRSIPLHMMMGRAPSTALSFEFGGGRLE